MSYLKDSLHEAPTKVLHGKSGVLGRVIVPTVLDIRYGPVYLLKLEAKT